MISAPTDHEDSKRVKAVLFDLDGTLLDTAPDLAEALNFVLRTDNRQPLPYEVIRPSVSHGASGLMKLGFGETLEADRSEQLRQQLIDFYRDNLCVGTCLFEGMELLLDALKTRGILWGVVTNKPAYLTDPLMETIGLAEQASCIVSGDTTPYSKPHPAPLLAACSHIDLIPSECIYIGDAQRDIEAGSRAGMKTVVARYGYISESDNIDSWGASFSIDHPLELIAWLENDA